MKSSTIKTCDTGSNNSETGKVGIKNRLKVIAASALLLAATSATAGIIYLPVGGQYANSELAPVTVQHLGNDIVSIHTTGLTGELSFKGSDFPPEYGVPASATGKLSFVHDLELVINLSLGVVEGRTSGQYIATTILNDWIEAIVQGTATCLPSNGRDCGQLVVDLEMQGVLSNPNDPASVGRLQRRILGSLVWDDTNVAHWAAMSANTTIGGNEGLIRSWIDEYDFYAGFNN